MRLRSAGWAQVGQSLARRPRAGLIWLVAVLGLSAVLAGELTAVALSTLAEGRTVAAMEIQVQAGYAAEAGVEVARAMVARGNAPRQVRGRCGKGEYSVRVERVGRGWRIVSEGTTEGPLGLVGRRTIEAVCSPTGRLVRWRYVKPLEPAPAGKT